MDIQLVDVDPVTRVLFFELSPRTLKGISKLVQIVVLSLLNIAGQDVLDPEKGGGLPSLISSNIDPSDSTEIFADVAQRVRKTETEVIDAQIGINDPPEEKLQELRIIELTNGENIDEVLVRIRIISEAGQATDVVM